MERDSQFKNSMSLWHKHLPQSLFKKESPMNNPTNSEQAMALFEGAYADFVAAFDVQDFWQILGDEVRLRGLSQRTKQEGLTVANVLRDTETYCLDLLNRG